MRIRNTSSSVPRRVHRLGAQAVFADEVDDLVAVLGVDEHAIGERLDPLTELGQPR